MCGIVSKLNNGYFDLVCSDFDIICLAETKNFSYDLSDTLLNNYTVFTLKNLGEELFATHGACILVKQDIAKFFKLIEGTSRQTIWLSVDKKLTGNEFILGSVYVPCESSLYYDAKVFEDLFTDISLFDLPVCLIGDFNARTGELNDVTDCNDFVEQFYGLNEVQDFIPAEYLTRNSASFIRSNMDKKVNNSGRMLIQMCHSLGLNIVNGRYGMDCNVGAYTCFNHNGGRSSIDYAIISPPLFDQLNSFSVMEFDDLLSDTHSAICLSFSTSFDVSKVSDQNGDRNQCGTNPVLCENLAFKWDEGSPEDFRCSFTAEDISLINDNLHDINPNPSQGAVDNFCEKLNTLFIDKAKNCGICKVKTSNDLQLQQGNKKHKPWFDQHCLNLRNDYHRIRNKIKFTNSNERLDKIKMASKKFKEIVKKKKAEYFKKLHKKLRVLKSNNSKEYWNLLNRASRHKQGGSAIELEVFKEHFKKISNTDSEITLDQDTNLPNFDQDVNEEINNMFTVDEIRAIIRKLKNGKACGIDHIRNEFLKSCPEPIMQLITDLFNLVLKTGIIPESWCIGMILPLYKNKGSVDDPDNYRGITLLSCIGKLFTAVINSRLTKYIDAVGALGDEQAGFRHGHSTTDHIFTLFAIIQLYIKNGRRLYCAFIDYRKAFDFVDRSSLWLKMLSTGINGNILKVIYNLYDKAKSCVKTRDGLSSLFHCNVGVRQGENLSPLLFAIFLNDFEFFISRRYKGLDKLASDINVFLSDDDVEHYLRIFALLYADDTIVLAESAEDLQLALNAAFEYCNRWKLTVNTGKTKVVIFSKRKVTEYPAFLFGHSHLQVVDDYIYLGTTFNYNGKFQKAISKQVVQARKAFYALLNKIYNLCLPVDIALELFNQLVMPVMLYGCEVWGFCNISQLEVLHRKFIKMLLGVNKYTPNVMVYGETGETPVRNQVIARMSAFFIRLENGKKSKLSYIMYKLLRKKSGLDGFECEWTNSMNETLSGIGMRDLWVGNGLNFTTEYVKKAIKLRVNDINQQNWASELEDHEYCEFYRKFKNNLDFEKYLTDLSFSERKALSRFRCRSNFLPIAQTRFGHEIDNDIICPLCTNNEIGDEIHYLFYCNYFKDDREKFICNKFLHSRNDRDIENLFNADGVDLRNLAQFVSIVINFFDNLSQKN